MIRVIKCGENRLRPGEVTRLSLVDLAESNCDRVAMERPVDPLAAARQQAEIILRTARAEAEALQSQAYTDGFTAGVRDGLQKADELIRRLEADIAALAEDRARLVDEVEPQVLKLCVEAVEKVIRHEIRTDPRVVLRVIKSVLRRVRDRDDVSVRVSPQELDFVRSQREELEQAAEGVRSLVIMSDRRVPVGGCVVECPSGTLDARIATQIERLSRRLEEAYEDQRQESNTGPDQIRPGDQQG